MLRPGHNMTACSPENKHTPGAVAGDGQRDRPPSALAPHKRLILFFGERYD